MPGLFISMDFPSYKRIAVLGGQEISEQAKEMARAIGVSIVANGCCLVTGGRAGAGEAASQGAYKQCLESNLDPKKCIVSLVPEGKLPSFQIGSYINVGRSYIERRIALVKNTEGAIVVGGGAGTASEVKIALIQAIMDGYGLIPVLGTGGEADRICSKIKKFEDPLFSDPSPSIERAQRIVQRMLMSGNCWYFGIDPVAAHDELFLGPSDPFSPKQNEIFSEHEKKELRSIRREYY